MVDKGKSYDSILLKSVDERLGMVIDKNEKCSLIVLLRSVHERLRWVVEKDKN